MCLIYIYTSRPILHVHVCYEYIHVLILIKVLYIKVLSEIPILKSIEDEAIMIVYIEFKNQRMLQTENYNPPK